MQQRTYRLKTMVVARLLAEMTAVAVMVLLPLGYLFSAEMRALPLLLKVMLGGVSVTALVALPCYAMMTWRVKTDDLGITAYSLLKKEFVEWPRIERLQLRTTLHWRRYVIAYEGGELTFPVWLDNGKELVDLIRDRLPGGAGGPRPLRAYKQDAVGIVFQFAKVVLGVAFIAVFWVFYQTIGSSRSVSSADSLLILFACLLLTLVVGWRCLVIALMPRQVELTGPEVIVRTCFFERRVAWADVLSLRPTFFVLPEGFMLNTKQGAFLIGDNLDDADELVEALQGRLNRPAGT